MSNSKIYVGGLGEDGRVSENVLEDAFKEFGTIRSVWVSKTPAGFGFVEFEDSRDADDAVRKMDGRDLEGCNLRVEMSRPRRDRGGGRGGYGGRSYGGGGGYGGGGRGGGGGGSCYNCGEPGHFSRECPNGDSRGGGGGYRSGGGGGYDRDRGYDRYSGGGGGSRRDRPY